MELLIILLLVLLAIFLEVKLMALSEQLTKLNSDLSAQTTLIGEVKTKVLSTSEAAKQLADAEAATTTAQATVDANTAALNDIIATP